MLVRTVGNCMDCNTPPRSNSSTACSASGLGEEDRSRGLSGVRIHGDHVDLREARRDDSVKLRRVEVRQHRIEQQQFAARRIQLSQRVSATPGFAYDPVLRAQPPDKFLAQDRVRTDYDHRNSRHRWRCSADRIDSGNATHRTPLNQSHLLDAKCSIRNRLTSVSQHRLRPEDIGKLRKDRSATASCRLGSRPAPLPVPTFDRR